MLRTKKKMRKRQVIDNKKKSKTKDFKEKKPRSKILLSLFKNNCKKKMKKICMRNKSFA
jgi:hypothetical protein